MTTRTAAAVQLDIHNEMTAGTLTRARLEALIGQVSVTNPAAAPGAVTMFWSGYVRTSNNSVERLTALQLGEAPAGGVERRIHCRASLRAC